MEKEDTHMGRVLRTSIDTVTQVPIKFVEKGTRKQKGGQEYRTEHKTRSASNTGRTTGREETAQAQSRVQVTAPAPAQAPSWTRAQMYHPPRTYVCNFQMCRTIPVVS